MKRAGTRPSCSGSLATRVDLFQGVVSLVVLSGGLPLSCTAVSALSIAGVLAALGRPL